MIDDRTPDRPSCVLLVEDNSDDRYIARHVLARKWPGIEILSAWDGRQAIHVLEQRVDDPPDLILLDINMPGMNGHEFLEAYYTDQGKSVPVVIMLTSSDQQVDIDRTRQYACVRDYFTKPLGREHTHTIEQIVPLLSAVG